MKPLLTAISIFLIASCGCQHKRDDPAITLFSQIGKEPESIRFSNHKKINDRGGHLQGVQLLQGKNGKYALLSGSSDTHAYYLVVKMAQDNEVTAVVKLMERPFKHAGGFQVFQNYMAIGIEDNTEKNRSKVSVYDIADPESPPVEPVSVIEREGEPMRSTAGCVGITKYNKRALIAVGDWNTIHIDFYACDFDKIGNNPFEKLCSIDSKTISKAGWIDPQWHAYQNINLINLDGALYLVGLGKTGKNHVADLFRLNADQTGAFQMTKLASEVFNCRDNTSFKAGAGLYVDKAGAWHIVSCGYHVENESFLNIFRGKR